MEVTLHVPGSRGVDGLRIYAGQGPQGISSQEPHSLAHHKSQKPRAITSQGPATKHQKVGYLDVSFGSSEPTIEVPASNVFTYIMALKAVLMQWLWQRPS